MLYAPHLPPSLCLCGSVGVCVCVCARPRVRVWQCPFPILRALRIIRTRGCELCGKGRVKGIKYPFRVFAHDACLEAQLSYVALCMSAACNDGVGGGAMMQVVRAPDSACTRPCLVVAAAATCTT